MRHGCSVTGGGGSPQPADVWERDERIVAWVYGAVLTGAAVVVASSKVATEPWQVALYTGIAMVVVWMCHSYAVFVGHGGRVEGGGVLPLLGHAFRTELPVLASSLPAIAAAGAAALLDADVSGAGYAGAIGSVATMTVAAGSAAKRFGAGPGGVAAGALSACLIGVLLIAAKVALK
jgi:hypothetical protein